MRASTWQADSTYNGVRRMQHLVLTSARTALRPLGLHDISAMHALWTDPSVRKYLWDDVVITEQRAADVLAATETDFARHRYGLWGVHIDSTELAGFCGLKSSDNGVAELLYGFRPQYWGQGLATETSRAVLSYAFNILRLPEVVAATDAPNEASIRVLQRLGMQFERRGTLNGLDTVFYRILRERFEGSGEQHAATCSGSG